MPRAVTPGENLWRYQRPSLTIPQIVRPNQILQYESSQLSTRPNWPAWIVSFVSGCPAGYVFSAYGGGICNGVVAGFVVGALTTLAAGSRRILMGVVGNVILIVTCFGFVSIRYVRAGKGSFWTDETFQTAFFFETLSVVLGGLIGSAIMVGAGRRAP